MRERQNVIICNNKRWHWSMKHFGNVECMKRMLESWTFASLLLLLYFYYIVMCIHIICYFVVSSQIHNQKSRVLNLMMNTVFFSSLISFMTVRLWIFHRTTFYLPFPRFRTRKRVCTCVIAFVLQICMRSECSKERIRTLTIVNCGNTHIILFGPKRRHTFTWCDIIFFN